MTISDPLPASREIAIQPAVSGGKEDRLAEFFIDPWIPGFIQRAAMQRGLDGSTKEAFAMLRCV